MSDRTLDPDLADVFAELRRQDEELEQSLGLTPSPKLPPSRPLEMPREDESHEEWRAREADAKQRFEAKYRYKEPSREDVVQMLEASLVRMRKSLDRPSGSDAVDAAGRRVYAASMATLEQAKAGATGAPPEMEPFIAVMRESHSAFEALWLARLEHLRTTCAPDMHPKVDKTIAWQKQQIATTLRMNEESEREMAELRRTSETSPGPG